MERAPRCDNLQSATMHLANSYLEICREVRCDPHGPFLAALKSGARIAAVRGFSSEEQQFATLEVLPHAGIEELELSGAQLVSKLQLIQRVPAALWHCRVHPQPPRGPPAGHPCMALDAARRPRLTEPPGHAHACNHHAPRSWAAEKPI